MLEVSELFYSLQGESTWAGLPCVFVRLCGCNLRCHYCDARYTYEEPGTLRTIDEVVEEIGSYGCKLVEVTGGEPLLQQDAIHLCSELLDRGYTVLLETNGSVSLAAVPDRACVIMDIKCPGSGMSDSLLQDNIETLKRRKSCNDRIDEVKFVVSSVEDYRFARRVIGQFALGNVVKVLLSPVADRFTPAELAELMLSDRLPARLQLQLHTLVWPTIRRGK